MVRTLPTCAMLFMFSSFRLFLPANASYLYPGTSQTAATRTEKIREVFDAFDAQTVEQSVENARALASDWYATARNPGGVLSEEYARGVWTRTKQTMEGSKRRYEEGFPEKAKFALGATMGLVSSRFVVSFAAKAVKIVGLTYVVTEISRSLGVSDVIWQAMDDLDGAVFPGIVNRTRDGIAALTASLTDFARDGFGQGVVKEWLVGLADADHVTATGLAAGSVVGFLF